jgi:hypothetical protein
MSVNIHIFVAPFDPENRICISEPAIVFLKLLYENSVNSALSRE